jgi:glycosyltransferase involved in cell wall biosynthesis
MFEGRSVAVVLPARNEAAWIGVTLDTLPRLVDLAIVVDDASEDATASEVEQRSVDRREGAARPRIELVRRAHRGGVGAAILDGYRAALARGIDVVVVMAGDGQMCPDDLPALLEPIARLRADYVKGDRFRHPDVRHVMPRARRRVGRVLSALTGLAIGMPELSDSQCGYTAITADALRALDLSRVWRGYGYPNDLLGHLARAGQRIEQVTVRPVYRGEKSGLRPRHVAVIGALIARAGLLRLASRSRRAQPGE